MDELYYAMVEPMEAKSARDKAKADYEGYSWGYHGQAYEDAVAGAHKRFTSAFAGAVREVLTREILEEILNRE